MTSRVVAIIGHLTVPQDGGVRKEQHSNQHQIFTRNRQACAPEASI